MDKLNVFFDNLLKWAQGFGPNLLGALAVLVIGLYVINAFSKLISKGLGHNKFDVSLQSFLSSMVSVSLKVLLMITVASMLGIQTTSFVAVVGALGLAVGLALQGSLSNFAGGVLVLIFKPFKVGDKIESQGQVGDVIDIQIFNTILLTSDHRTVILANGAVSNNTIINYTKQGNLRVELTTEIDPKNDIDTVRSIIQEVFDKHPLVLKQPVPTTNVLKLDKDSVVLSIMPYTAPQNYWDVYFGVQEMIKKAFQENNIAAPEPQLWIHQKG